MGLLDYFSPSKTVLVVEEVRQSEETNVNTQNTPSESTSPKDVPLPLSPIINKAVLSEEEEKLLKRSPRRFSFRPQRKHAISTVQEQEKEKEASQALSKRLLAKSSNSDKRAQQSALVVRSLIVGPTASSPVLSSAVAKPQMSKLKSQLLDPKSANKIIAHLRELSADSGDAKPDGPIHAVCLPYTDSEEHDLHFSKLAASESLAVTSFAVINSAPVEALSGMLNDMHVVDLVKSPDFGLGQPGDGKGILAGAIPTAETVIKGIEQITPQLMALGYATGRAVLPDHTGIHPPTDRMSVLTYWWGLEVILPPPSLSYLASADSVSGAIVNFLSALALINNGVREILPFVRYISQFIDFEFKNIQAQNRGKGVVCAATWIMPAALVPRPWDFAPPERKPTAKPVDPGDDTKLPASDKDSNSSVHASLPAKSSSPVPVALVPSIPGMLAGASATSSTSESSAV